MTRVCPQEQDVLDLVAIGQWPSRADASLQAHAATCDICRDLAAVAGAIAESRDAVAPAAHVPDASVVWYRAQVLARIDAARRASRPMLIAQLAALGCVVAVVLVWSGAGGQWFTAWWQWLAGLMPERSVASDMAPSWTPSTIPGFRWMIVAAVALTAVVPVG